MEKPEGCRGGSAALLFVHGLLGSPSAKGLEQVGMLKKKNWFPSPRARVVQGGWEVRGRDRCWMALPARGTAGYSSWKLFKL